MDRPPTNEDLGERKDSWPVMVGGTALLFVALIFVVPRVMKFVAGPMEDNAHEHLLLQSAGHMKQVETRLIAFHAQYGRYPAGYKGLDMLVWPEDAGSPPPWAVTKRNILMDGWARPLIYKNLDPGAAHPFELSCLGRDGRPGGEGPDRDITNWDWPSRVEAPWPVEEPMGATPAPSPTAPIDGMAPVDQAAPDAPAP